MQPRPSEPERAPRAVALPLDARRRLVLLGAAVAGLLAVVAFATLARAEESRTLEEVEIEGEVRLPQVLFITSREADRPLDYLDAWAGPAAADIAAGAWTPPRIHLLAPVAGPSDTSGEVETGETPVSENESIESTESPSATEEDLQ